VHHLPASWRAGLSQDFLKAGERLVPIGEVALILIVALPSQRPEVTAFLGGWRNPFYPPR
jgi:hypothetical protein